MRWFLILTAGVAALIALAGIVGAFLPAAHTATASGRTAGTPERVWKVLTDPRAYPDWRPGIDEVEIVERTGNRVERWIERSAAGAVHFEVVDRRPPERLVVRIAEGDLPLGGTWTFDLRPEDGGTRIFIQEAAEVHSPFFRFVGRFVLGYGAALEDLVEGLATRMASLEDRSV